MNMLELKEAALGATLLVGGALAVGAFVAAALTPVMLIAKWIFGG